MVSKAAGVVLIFTFLVFVSPSAMAMGRKVTPAQQPPSLGTTQPEVDLIKPDQLPPTPPIDTEMKEKKPQEVSVQLAPDEPTKNRQIQTALKNAGYDPGPVDGKIGSKTKKAIKDFQTASGLRADGKVGPKTWTKLSTYILKENTEKGGN